MFFPLAATNRSDLDTPYIREHNYAYRVLLVCHYRDRDASGNLIGIGTATSTISSTISHIGIRGTITTVPEPATLVLLGTGLAGVVAKVRKRRKAI